LIRVVKKGNASDPRTYLCYCTDSGSAIDENLSRISCQKQPIAPSPLISARITYCLRVKEGDGAIGCPLELIIEGLHISKVCIVVPYIFVCLIFNFFFHSFTHALDHAAQALNTQQHAYTHTLTHSTISSHN
jgi:hypothetical protein